MCETHIFKLLYREQEKTSQFATIPLKTTDNISLKIRLNCKTVQDHTPVNEHIHRIQTYEKPTNREKITYMYIKNHSNK